MERKKIYLIILGLAAITLVIVSVLFFPFSKNQINFLIPGVPYYGFYNHFFDESSPTISSVADILGFWGDNRFSLEKLSEKFPSFAADKSTEYGTRFIESFFRSSGYETRRSALEPGREIDEIKKYVNSKDRIPVIIFQKLSGDPERFSLGTRVVIGVFDKRKKIMVHDYFYGNNYEISYDKFQSLFQKDARAILAVWPSLELKKGLETPNYNINYPIREDAMDKIGESLVLGADALNLRDEKKYDESVKLYQQFIDTADIGLFPPIYRVAFYTALARLYLLAGNSNEAIKILKEKALPINEDLSRAFSFWTAQINFFKERSYTQDRLANPFYFLGQAYLAKGERELAKESFQEALKILPSHTWSEQALNKINGENKK